jgi:iron(III) transport system ATP-binding protein
MNKGRIAQIDKPQTIYQKPANLFVSTFIGRTNIVDAVLKDSTLNISGAEISSPIHTDSQINVKVSIRPEEFIIDEQGAISGTIEHSVFLGLNTHYFVKTSWGQEIEIIERSSARAVYAPKTEISIKVDSANINIFDEQGAVNLTVGGKK